MVVKYESKYYGDGKDDFSVTPWETELWKLLAVRYAEKSAADEHFKAPDWVTIVECEEELSASGLERTYR